MAILPVTLAELLRPWRAAGITHFLRQPGVEEGGATNPDSAEGQPPASLEQAGRSFVSCSEAAMPQALYNAQTPVVFARPNKKPEAPADTSLWPAPWRDLLARTSPAPLVWTYPDLGVDLSGHGSKERSACLRQLIANLALPRGSSAFWPLTMPAPSIPNLDESAFFRAGLVHIRPIAVIFLSPAGPLLTGLPLTILLPFTQQIYRGKLFLLLPGFEELLKGSDAVERATTYLRSAISGLHLGTP